MFTREILEEFKLDCYPQVSDFLKKHLMKKAPPFSAGKGGIFSVDPDRGSPGAAGAILTFSKQKQSFFVLVIPKLYIMHNFSALFFWKILFFGIFG